MTPLQLLAHWATHMHHYQRSDSEVYRREKERQMQRLTWKVVKRMVGR